MSLSAEERLLLKAIVTLHEGREASATPNDEAIWLAAKNYWLEQAAQVCDVAGNAAFGVPEIVEGTCDRLAVRIRALKDQHG